MSEAQKMQAVKYEVLEKSLIGNELFEAGAIAEYDGLPAENLKPLCDEGRRRAEEYKRTNEIRVAKMLADHQESAVGDPAQFLAAFVKYQQEENAKQAEQIGVAVGQAVGAAVAAALAAAGIVPAAPAVEEKAAKAK